MAILLNLVKYSPDGVSPKTMFSDNGPQFASQNVAAFASSYQFTHHTSSLHYPASNVEGERAVQTATDIIACEDTFTAFLAFRTTPISSK